LYQNRGEREKIPPKRDRGKRKGERSRPSGTGERGKMEKWKNGMMEYPRGRAESREGLLIPSIDLQPPSSDF